MRILVAILVVLVSTYASAQTPSNTRKKAAAKPKPAPKIAPKPTPTADAFADEDLSSKPMVDPLAGVSESRYPLHSTLYFTPHKKIGLGALVGVTFGSSSVETPNFPAPGQTATDEMETNGLISQFEISYGVLPDLNIGLEIGYASETQKNSSYRDTAGSVGILLAPDVKHSGLLDPQVFVNYRPLESDFVLDLGGSLRLGFQSAERGFAQDTNSNGRGDTVTNGNLASGSYGTELGARAGYHLSDRLNIILGLKGEYNFEGSQTTKRSVGGDLESDVDAYLEYAARGEIEYYLTPEFIIAPFVNVVMTPKTKASTLNGGVTTITENAANKTIGVGVTGNYLLQSNLALKAGYAFSSVESAKIQSSTGGAAFIDVSNTKDRESHSIVGSIAYEF